MKKHWIALAIVIAVGLFLAGYSLGTSAEISTEYTAVSPTAGYTAEVSSDDLVGNIQIDELKKLILEPPKARVVTRIEHLPYESEPDVEVIPTDSLYRVRWDDPLAYGWIDFEGPDLRTNTVSDTFYQQNTLVFDLEIVEGENRWYGSIDLVEPSGFETEDLLCLQDISVITAEDTYSFLPFVGVGYTDELTLGGGVAGRIGNTVLGGYYLDEETWEIGGGYTFDCGAAVFAKASASDISIFGAWIF